MLFRSPEVVPKLLLHMSTSSIMDLLLKIISMEESPEGKGTVQVYFSDCHQEQVLATKSSCQVSMLTSLMLSFVDHNSG